MTSNTLPFYKTYSRIIFVLSAGLYGLFCWANPELFIESFVPALLATVALGTVMMHLLKKKTEDEQRKVARHIVFVSSAALLLLSYLFFQYAATSNGIGIGELLKLWF